LRSARPPSINSRFEIDAIRRCDAFDTPAEGCKSFGRLAVMRDMARAEGCSITASFVADHVGRDILRTNRLDRRLRRATQTGLLLELGISEGRIGPALRAEVLDDLRQDVAVCRQLGDLRERERDSKGGRGAGPFQASPASPRARPRACGSVRSCTRLAGRWVAGEGGSS
jgi:hypothetical protein